MLPEVDTYAHFFHISLPCLTRDQTARTDLSIFHCLPLVVRQHCSFLQAISSSSTCWYRWFGHFQPHDLWLLLDVNMAALSSLFEGMVVLKNTLWLGSFFTVRSDQATCSIFSFWCNIFIQQSDSWKFVGDSRFLGRLLRFIHHVYRSFENETHSATVGLVRTPRFGRLAYYGKCLFALTSGIEQ